MKKFFVYVRVSTARQGQFGVSLPEQREIIQAYAAKFNLPIAQWFEERVTAAKTGRPVWNNVIQLLKSRAASGLIVHKVDRSMRNRSDWAELNSLIDSGVEVHFANEALDLNTRGGRLAADIQAVIAIDYIQNLREEAKKGIYGRLKQGLYPMPAPLGYLDMGAGKPKVPDPATASLVKLAFEMYSTARYSLAALQRELHLKGLRRKSDRRLSRNFLGRMLRSTFYMGLITIKKTGQTYFGVHQPLISKALFDNVQEVLEGRMPKPDKQRHEFTFRQLFRCKLCGRHLIAERQKGHVYYRCQKKTCPTKCIREEVIQASVVERLKLVQLDPREHDYIKRRFDHLRDHWQEHQRQQMQNVEIQLAQLLDRLNRLTDVYIDQAIDKQTFEQRKTALLMERRGTEDALQELKAGSPGMLNQMDNLLELLKSAYSQYVCGNAEEKRTLVKQVFSNRDLNGKTLEITLALPFNEVAWYKKSTSGGAPRATSRTLDRLARKIWNFFQPEKAQRKRASSSNFQLAA